MLEYWETFPESERQKDVNFAGPSILIVSLSSLVFLSRCPPSGPHKYLGHKAFRQQSGIGSILAGIHCVGSKSSCGERKVQRSEMRKFRHNPRPNKVIAVCVLMWGFILFIQDCGSLRAQQPADAADGAYNENEAVSLPDAPSPNADTSATSPDNLTFRNRLRLYERSFKEPEHLIGPLLGAGVSQATDTPPEWGEGAAGFGRRAGSGYGRSVLGGTIALGVASIDHEDPRFVPSQDSGILRRARHAIVSTFVSGTNDGGSMPAYSRLVGIYGAAFIANAWEPPSQDSTRHALERGSTALLSSVGWHLLDEFGPDIRKALLHKRN